MDPISAGVALAKAGATLLGAKTARPVVTTFLEKISNVTGIVFKPWQIRRDAHAEADATIIKAEAEAKVSVIKAEADEKIQTVLERSEERQRSTSIREQNNLDSIVINALESISDNAKPEKIDEDWLANYFDKARLFSDNDMQILWSHILAEEANIPGKFSRRTINALADLDKDDAIMFKDFCSFNMTHLEDNTNICCIIDTEEDIYNSAGVSYSSLLHLNAIGLINTNFANGMSLVTNELEFKYFDTKLKLENSDTKSLKPNRLYVGVAVLTKFGEELSTICQPKENSLFISYLTNYWNKRGFSVTII